MHESSLARSLVRTINVIATEQGALGVVAARVRLGSFSSMSPERLREQFTSAARGTRVEGALLKVNSHNGDVKVATGRGEGVVLESVELRLELTASL